MVATPWGFEPPRPHPSPSADHGVLTAISPLRITPAETDSASGSLGAIQQLAGSVGVATLATLYTATSHPAARGLAITALATAALLAAAALTLLLPTGAAD